MRPSVKISCKPMCRITLGFSWISAVAFSLTAMFFIGCYFKDFKNFSIYRSYEP